MSPSGRIISLIGIGTTAGDRVWRLKAKDSTQTPFIIVQTITETPNNSHDATAIQTQGSVLISCYGVSESAARGLGDAIVALIEGNHEAGAISIDSREEGFDSGVTPGLYQNDIYANVQNNSV